MRQCFVLALQAAEEDGGLAGWAGLQGKLKPLPQGFVAINVSSPAAGAQEAAAVLTPLFAGCLEVRREAAEESLMDDS